MQSPYWKSRTLLMLDEEKMEQINKAHVLVIGIGGVGGICAEMIVRAGVGQITLIDNDIIDESNCNRQIVALRTNVGNSKIIALSERLLQINPDLIIHMHSHFVDKEYFENLVQQNLYTFISDCIDTLRAKTDIIITCLANKLPMVSSMGAGGKTNPMLTQIADLSYTYNCNLARYVRKYLQKNKIKGGVACVFSPEIVDQTKIIETENAKPKKSIIGTISYMPNIFGCYCASVAIRYIIGDLRLPLPQKPQKKVKRKK